MTALASVAAVSAVSASCVCSVHLCCAAVHISCPFRFCGDEQEACIVAGRYGHRSLYKPAFTPRCLAACLSHSQTTTITQQAPLQSLHPLSYHLNLILLPLLQHPFDNRLQAMRTSLTHQPTPGTSSACADDCRNASPLPTVVALLSQLTEQELSSVVGEIKKRGVLVVQWYTRQHLAGERGWRAALSRWQDFIDHVGNVVGSEDFVKEELREILRCWPDHEEGVEEGSSGDMDEEEDEDSGEEADDDDDDDEDEEADDEDDEYEDDQEEDASEESDSEDDVGGWTKRRIGKARADME